MPFKPKPKEIKPIKKRPNLSKINKENYTSILSVLRKIKNTNERRFALQLIRGIVLPQSKTHKREITYQPPISHYLEILSGKPTVLKKAVSKISNLKTKTYKQQLTDFPKTNINPINFLPLLRILEQTKEFESHKKEINTTIKAIEKRAKQKPL